MFKSKQSIVTPFSENLIIVKCTMPFEIEYCLSLGRNTFIQRQVRFFLFKKRHYKIIHMKSVILYCHLSFPKFLLEFVKKAIKNCVFCKQIIVLKTFCAKQFFDVIAGIFLLIQEQKHVGQFVEKLTSNFHKNTTTLQQRQFLGKRFSYY